MHNYSLKDLFRDEQRHILQRILADTVKEFEDKLITLYENSRSLMGFVRETGMPVPDYFVTTAGDALNLKLQKMFASETIDVDRVRGDAGEIKNWNVTLNCVALEFIIRRRLERTMHALQEDQENAQRLSELLVLVEAIQLLPVEVNLWQTQNMYWTMLHTSASAATATVDCSHDVCCWSEAIKNLGTVLRFNIPALLAAPKATI
jgi:hypothetical protein